MVRIIKNTILRINTRRVINSTPFYKLPLMNIQYVTLIHIYNFLNELLYMDVI